MAGACFFHEFEQLGGIRREYSAWLWWLERAFFTRSSRSGGFVEYTACGFGGFWCGARFFHEFEQLGEIRILYSTRVWWVWWLARAFFHAFGQLGGIRRGYSARFWWVWWLERAFFTSSCSSGGFVEYTARGFGGFGGWSVRHLRPAPKQREVSPPTHPESGISASQAVRKMSGCGGGARIP